MVNGPTYWAVQFAPHFTSSYWCITFKVERTNSTSWESSNWEVITIAVWQSLRTLFSDRTILQRDNVYAQPEHTNCNRGFLEEGEAYFFFFFKMMIAHLNNRLLPQHALHQVILRNHMEMSVLLLLKCHFWYSTSE